MRDLCVCIRGPADLADYSQRRRIYTRIEFRTSGCKFRVSVSTGTAGRRPSVLFQVEYTAKSSHLFVWDIQAAETDFSGCTLHNVAFKRDAGHRDPASQICSIRLAFAHFANNKVEFTISVIRF